MMDERIDSLYNDVRAKLEELQKAFEKSEFVEEVLMALIRLSQATAMLTLALKEKLDEINKPKD